MLRALWLAVAVMGAIVQWTMNVLMPPTVDHATMLFSAALFAGVLYVVGAAATTFSVEHEEETYNFLTGLPTAWWPVYVGKLLVVAISAAALAGVLSVVGWMLCGFDTPGGHDTPAALGLFGVAIVEGLAWGTFFSLVVKRPLVAAILTLVVGALAVHLAVNATSSYAVASANPEAYVEAIPVRLAIVGVVLAASVLVARRWLAVGTQPANITWGRIAAAAAPHWDRTTASVRRVANVAEDGMRGRAMSRLIWQTWRESWKLLPLPLLVAGVLYLGVSAVLGLSQVLGPSHPGPESTLIATVATMLFIPALYGAMVFAADQRRGGYRFLAEHAARPRYVWLARQIVWLGALIVLLIIVTLIVSGATSLALRNHASQTLDYYVRWGSSGVENFSDIAYQLLQGTTFAIVGAGLACFGTLAAYAVGQLCSMLLRSEIMAAFVALLLSVGVSAWVAALFAWQLSGWLFLLPVAAGWLLATWLRAPDWIAQRNSWRAWVKPVLAVVATLVVVGFLLPIARLAQLPGVAEPFPQANGLPSPAFDKLIAEGRETAQKYIKSAERLMAGPKEDPLEPWRKPEYSSSGPELGGIDETKIPLDEMYDFVAAQARQEKLIRELIAAAVNDAIKASKRPTCHFDFDLRQIAPKLYGDAEKQWGLHSYWPYRQLTELLGVVAGEPMSEPDQPFDRYLAALRMSKHLRSGQPSVVLIDQLQQEQTILERIGRWATAEGRTKEQLEAARDKLIDYFHSRPDLQGALAADHFLVRHVLTGQEMPISLAISPASPMVYLAYLANQLPWERERALRALDLITLKNIDDAGKLAENLADMKVRELGVSTLRRWLRPRYPVSGVNLPAAWELAWPAAATSYLTSLEYNARVPINDLYRVHCDTEVHRRAALIQIALAMYRLDHGEYPPRLTDLAPKYLDPLPIDPYTRQPFQYASVGLDLPLRSSAYANFERIDANTPLFWSVGAGNSRLKQRNSTSWESDEEQPDVDMRAISETAYELQSDEPAWWNDPALVFPFAK